MKRRVERLNEDAVVAEYPLRDRVPGWYFRVVESSAGVWEISGIDLWGRRVSATGTDPDELLERCSKDAQAITGRLGE